MQPSQDWEYTTLSKNVKQNANQAIQQNKSVYSVQKHEHMNKNELDARHVATVLNDEEDNFSVEHVCHEFKIALQQARNAKGLTQEQLANLVNEKKSVITDYEKGTAIPSMGVVSKLEQRLGVKLPRPVPKKKKAKKSL